jgi:hypothetical protein
MESRLGVAWSRWTDASDWPEGWPYDLVPEMLIMDFWEVCPAPPYFSGR